MAITVYEVRNQTLKELYVGFSATPFAKLKNEHHRSRPGALKHWDYRKHLIVYAEIDHKLPDEDAKTFFTSYQKMVYVPDFRTLTD